MKKKREKGNPSFLGTEDKARAKIEDKENGKQSGKNEETKIKKKENDSHFVHLLLSNNPLSGTS